MKQEEVAKVIEEVVKHLPNKHDQKTHAGDAAGDSKKQVKLSSLLDEKKIINIVKLGYTEFRSYLTGKTKFDNFVQFVDDMNMSEATSKREAKMQSQLSQAVDYLAEKLYEQKFITEGQRDKLLGVNVPDPLSAFGGLEDYPEDD